MGGTAVAPSNLHQRGTSRHLPAGPSFDKELQDVFPPGPPLRSAPHRSDPADHRRPICGRHRQPPRSGPHPGSIPLRHLLRCRLRTRCRLGGLHRGACTDRRPSRPDRCHSWSGQDQPGRQPRRPGERSSDNPRPLCPHRADPERREQGHQIDGDPGVEESPRRPGHRPPGQGSRGPWTAQPQGRGPGPAGLEPAYP